MMLVRRDGEEVRVMYEVITYRGDATRDMTTCYCQDSPSNQWGWQ